MKITALLPMKGNSERVPNKNMKSFSGLPLYRAVLGVLQQSEYIKKIVINTDSDVIKNDVQDKFPDININDRPKRVCGDFVSMNEVIACDLEQDEGEHFLQTHSTNPLLTVKTLDKAINSYFSMSSNYDSLFSVTKYQTRLYWEDGNPVNHNLTELLRTQDLPPLFEENSNFYIFSKTSFKNADKNRIGTKPLMFEVDRLEAIDIDEPVDFELAEILYKMKNK